MKRLSWKYMAGLVDGEGCIDMQNAILKKGNGRFYCRPRLRISLSGIPGEMMIPTFINNFGGSVDGRRREFQNPNWKPAYCWQLTGSVMVRKFIQNIVNHLIIKKQQARFIIWWLDNIGGKQVTEEVKRSAMNELKAMKVDPHRLSERAVAEVKKVMATGAIVG